MKLQELAAPSPTKQIAKVFESYFGSTIEFDRLNSRQTKHLLNRVQGLLREHRSSSDRYQSQQNPSYLKLVMMEQALKSRLNENMMPAIPAAPGVPQKPAVPGQQPAVAGQPVKPGAPVAGQPVKPGAPVAPGAAPAATTAPDPKLAAALKKSQAGQTLTPDEQKLVAGAAMMQAESRLRRAMKRLNESEVQQAQVVLAAQDMVDKMQGMLEDVSELQFKELPALVDSIKNQVGIDQATQFNADASAALTGLMQNLQGAKQQMDAALGVVTGQTPPPVPGEAAANAALGGSDMAAAGADMAAGADLEADAADDLAAPAEEEPAGGAGLGRARR